jgi:hypothetical protein
MILLSVNIRGVGGPLKRASLRRLLDLYKPTVIFLQETLVDASTARDFIHPLRPSWLTCAASSVGNSGGLLASWDPSFFDFLPMLSPGGILLSGHCFDLKANINLLNVYGPCADRKLFWQRLDDLGLLAAKNLILAGDLNLTTSSEEIWGDRAQIDPLHSFFNRLFYKNALVDLKPAELIPTWRNGRQGIASIAKRLDRFLIAEDLLTPSCCYRSWVNLPFISDHASICLQLGTGRFGVGLPFKFNPQWLREASFNSLVKSVWTDSSSLPSDDPQGNLSVKLSRLKSRSILWLKEKKLAEQADLHRIEQELDLLLRHNPQAINTLDTDLKIRGLEEERNATCVLMKKDGG